MNHYRALYWLCLALPCWLKAQPSPCDPPLVASISANTPVCLGALVVLTFHLPVDDGDGFDVTYRIAGSDFAITGIVDGHTVSHTVASNSTAILLRVENNDDDDDDCYTDFNQVVPIIVSAPALGISSQINPFCNLNNGSITVVANNGLSPYQYNIDGGMYQTNGTFSGLSAGLYTLGVQDNIGCLAQLNVTLSTPPSPTANVASQTQPTCGQSNGSITAGASGGTAPYQFSLNGGAFQTNPTFANLPAGTYTLRVRDANNCEDDATATLNSPGGPTANVASQTQPTCGQSNGSITAGASNGTAPYQFSLNGGTFQTNPTFANLPAGTYTLRVRDANNCEDDATATLNSPGGPTANVASQTQPTCGQSNGSITAGASNGTAPYQFSLNGGAFQTNPTFANLPAGTYTLRVRDANNCEDDATATLSSPGGPTANVASQTQPTCGQSNGSITAGASNGAAPYQFSLNGGTFQTNPTFANLPAGSYTLRVRDANNCEDDATATLSSPGGPTANVVSQTQPTCGQSNGSITAGASNGTAPYQFSLNGGAFQTNPSFANLPAGTYTLRVRDANNCEDDATATLNSPGGPTANVASQTQPTCGQSNGSITAGASNGTAPYQFSLNGGAFQTNPTFANLPAGTYTLRVRDANNCEDDVAATLNSASSLSFVVTAKINPTCGQNNGILTISALGGTPPYQYSINQGAFQNTNTFQDLAAGTALLRVRDALRCEAETTATLANEGPLLAPPEAMPDDVGDVTANTSLVIPVLENDRLNAPVSLRILQRPTQGSASTQGQNITYNAFDNPAGFDTLTYEVCYSNCNNLCDTAIVSLRHVLAEGPCVITGDTSNLFTNGITPNGDGENDFLKFRIVSVEECAVNYAQSEIVIYNRWGDIVYEASPYENDWDGTIGKDKEPLPPGVYYFVLRIALEKVYSQFGSVIILK